MEKNVTEYRKTLHLHEQKKRMRSIEPITWRYCDDDFIKFIIGASIENVGPNHEGAE